MEIKENFPYRYMYVENAEADDIIAVLTQEEMKNPTTIISSDKDLTSNGLLYTDDRHPNSKGNKKIAELIQNRISQILSN